MEEPRHHPHVNRVRVCAKEGHVDATAAELRFALAIAPEYRPVCVEIHRPFAVLN